MSASFLLDVAHVDTVNMCGQFAIVMAVCSVHAYSWQIELRVVKYCGGCLFLDLPVFESRDAGDGANI